MKPIMSIFTITLLVLISACSSSSIKIDGNPIAQYMLKNGEIYQYNYVRPDGTNGIMYSNFDNKLESKRPAILYLGGSGCDSLLVTDENGKFRNNSFVQIANEIKDNFWIFAIEKRGVKTFDSTQAMEECSKEYHEYGTLKHRTEDNIEILKWLKNQKNIDNSKIVILGVSEGTDVAARIGANSKIPTHMGYFCGSGPTQMFDFAIFARHLWGDKNEPAEATEARMESLMAQYRDIMNNPESTDKYYFGHPYKRWSSFFKTSPYEDLLKFDRPIFVAHGSADKSVPIEGADFIEVEFIRNGKNNLTLKRYPNLTHSFWNCEPMTYRKTKSGVETVKNESCNPETANKFPMVIQDFLTWLKEN